MGINTTWKKVNKKIINIDFGADIGYYLLTFIIGIAVGIMAFKGGLI